MTSPVTPPAPVAVAEFPQLGDPAFNAKAYAYGSAMPAVVGNISDMADSAFTNATSASESADAAVASAASASSASSAALGAANFKGLWDDLTGAIAKPASTKHNGRFWLLLNNVADVTASEPGVSADWTSLDSGDVVQEITAAGSVNMVVGVLYPVLVTGVTLVAPASLQPGDRLMADSAFNGTFLVDWNGHTVKSDTQSTPMTIPAYRGFKLTYSGSTLA